MAANDKQHGGDHYRGSPVQHWDLSALYQWDPMQYQIIKYTMRWRDKNGLLDLEKVGHFVEKYIEDVKAGRMPGPSEYPLKPHGRDQWLRVLGAVSQDEYDLLRSALDDALKSYDALIAPVPVHEDPCSGPVHWGYSEDGTRQLTFSEVVAKIGSLPDDYMLVRKDDVNATGWRNYTFEGTKGGPDGEFDYFRCKWCLTHFRVDVSCPPTTAHKCKPVQP